MTEIEKRRQKIVEGVAARIADAHGFDWAELADDSIHRAFYLQLAEELVIYEDSQGAVLQVDRELPQHQQYEQFEATYGRRPKDIIFNMGQLFREQDMKETGIIMSGNHPKLILDGIKTMTRRTWGLEEINKDPANWVYQGFFEFPKDGCAEFSPKVQKGYHSGLTYHIKCPYGQVGNRLIIKESYAVDKLWDDKKPSEINGLSAIWYPADGAEKPIWAGRTRSARFMCNWMSRAKPEITEVRVERLQEIIETDAIAEGVATDSIAPPEMQFCLLWNSLNAKRGYGWKQNPWVWCISFKNLEVD